MVYAVAPWATAEGGFTSTQRLMAELGIWKPRFAGKLRCIPGNVSKTQFGLAPDAYEALAREVEAIVHTGGSLRWTLDPDLIPVNINGIMNMVVLARKNGASLHYMSTASLTAEDYADEKDKALFRQVQYFDVKRQARGQAQPLPACMHGWMDAY
jgi:thioester reductase-like protein